MCDPLMAWRPALEALGVVSGVGVADDVDLHLPAGVWSILPGNRSRTLEFPRKMHRVLLRTRFSQKDPRAGIGQQVDAA